MDSDNNDSDDGVDRLFNYLVEEGALELISIDPDTHEPLYRITQKCKDILPAMYEEFRNELNEIIFDLWQRGIVEVRFGADSESDMVRLTVEGFKEFQKCYQELSEDHVRFVKRLMDDIIETEMLERKLSDDF